MRVLKKTVTFLLILTLTATNLYMGKTQKAQAAEESIITNQDFLKANGKVLKNNYGNGSTVYLRGTNAGGYMIQEFWMCPTNYSTNVTCQLDILNTLTNRFGSDNARTLINAYEANYWTESDFDECASLGMNCIRLPLWYRNFVDANGNWYSDAFDRVDWFVEQAGKRGIYVVLDMHGAYGSQNGSDHSGVDGGDNKIDASEFFFGNNAASNQEKYYAMWEKIAEHYKGNPTVAGYDLLNEPYCTYRYNSGYSDDYLHSLLWGIYDNAYKRIRAIDSDHVIIMEATWDSWDLPNPSSYGWENVMYEYHNYEYSDYDNASNTQITSMQNKINNIFSSNYNVPSYMGEFCYFNNLSAWESGLQLLNDNGLNWTSWSYKCVAEYGNWGIMNQSVDKVNVESDSYETILSKWSNVGSSYENSGLANVVKQYTPGTVSAKDSTSGTSTLSAGKYYLTCSDKIVCAEDEGNSPLIANRDSYGGAWETLYVIDNGDGTISLKSDINGKYVCAVIDENCQLLARSESISTWEKFYPVHIKDNQYALLAVANNKYVKADFDDSDNNGQLKAVSDEIGGAWECFEFYSLNADEETAQQTTAAPTTTQQQTTVAPTTTQQQTTVVPTTTQQQTTVSPTTTQQQTTVAPTTTKEETVNAADKKPTEVVGAIVQNIEGNKVTFAWGQSLEQIELGQQYNVYIDGNLYGTYSSAQTLEYIFTTEGTHIITIKAELNGEESEGAVLTAEIEKSVTTKEETTVAPTTVAPTTAAPTTVEPTTVAPTTVAPTTAAPTTVAPTTVEPTTEEKTTPEPTTQEQVTEQNTEIVISDKINIEGFQISQVSWGLRTVSSVEPEINGQKVVEFGNIYAIKQENVAEEDMVCGSENSNVAEYKATEQGIIDTNFSNSETAINYVRTMVDNGTTSTAYSQEYMIRAYAKLADGSYVYSKAYDYSIFKVAKQLYDNNKMSTSSGHDYIYNNILKVVDSNYPEVDYNWSNIVVKPN